VSVGFGVPIGSIFPVYSNIFVVFKSGPHRIAFILGCVLAS
jgi:hypothetical protein